MQHDSAYDLKPVKTPTLRGAGLRLAVALVEKPWIAGMLGPLLRRNLGVEEFRAAKVDETPTFFPLHPCPSQLAATPDSGEVPQIVPRKGFRLRRIRDYQNAYRKGVITPEQVAERVLAGIETADGSGQPLRAFIASNRDDVLAQARRANRRYSEGRTLGPLDGVPVAVKDEVDMVPYPTTGGTRMLGTRGAAADSTVVARLRAAGALLVGKTNMHEIGILPNACNPHYGTVRNPYDLTHEAGGSSSGSAAAVAAGLCPAAVGADGGGSIRIPAAYCGVIGLKPTFGRVSESGAVPLDWSVAHLGPIGATAEDTALLYQVIAGPDAADPFSCAQPPIRVGEFDGALTGVRIGVYRDWFHDADPDVVAACEKMLNYFVRIGADRVDVVLPNLRLIAVAHGLTIHSEMAANMERYADQRRDFGLTTRLMLANVQTMRSSDYVQAQRIRTRAIHHFRSALAAADVIATPTTPMVAPALSEQALAGREVNVGRVLEAMRFVNPGNLTGLPAITIPAGYDSQGLPIGMQLMARPWEEHMLFRLAYAAEVEIARAKPALCFDVLPELKEG